MAALLAAGADPCAVENTGRTAMANICSIEYYNRSYKYRVATLVVAAGDRSWNHVPIPCPGLETALVVVWKTTPKATVTQELAQLFRRLEPGVQAKVQATLRALHHGGLPEALRMAVLVKALG